MRFRHALVLGPDIAAPWRDQDVGHAARLLAALRRAGVRTSLATSLDASAPLGTLAPDSVFLGVTDAPAVMTFCEQCQPDVLFWLPGGIAARQVVNDVEQTGFFQQASIELYPRPERLRRLEDPSHLAQLVRADDVTVPDHRIANGLGEVRAAAKSLGLPVSIRALDQLTSVPWHVAFDEEGLGRLAGEVPTHHWVVRRTPTRGIVADAVIACDVGGCTTALGLILHGAPSLADAGLSAVCWVPPEPSTPLLGRLAGVAARVAAAVETPGLLIVRLATRADADECAVLDVALSPGPAQWVAGVGLAGTLSDLAVRLAGGVPLANLENAMQRPPASQAVVAVRRRPRGTALETPPGHYVWTSATTIERALDAIIAPFDHDEWPGTSHRSVVARGATLRPGPREEASRPNDEPDPAIRGLASVCAMAGATGGPAPTRELTGHPEMPIVRSTAIATPRTEVSPSCLLYAPPISLNEDPSECWAIMHVASALRARGALPVVRTTSLSLASLVLELGFDAVAMSTAPGDLTNVVTNLGLTRVITVGRQPAHEFARALEDAGLHVSGACGKVLADPLRVREVLDDERIPRVPLSRATSLDDAVAIADAQGWPLHVSMTAAAHADAVVHTRNDLEEFARSWDVSPERPLLLASVAPHGRMLEGDILCYRGRSVLTGWRESLQGISSTGRLNVSVSPPQRTYPEQLRRSRTLADRVVASLHAHGAVTVRFLVTEHDLRVVSVVPGATRHWPSLSRALGIDWAGRWVDLLDAAPEDRRSDVTPGGDRIAVSLRLSPPSSNTASAATLRPWNSLTLVDHDADEALWQALISAGLQRPLRAVWLSAKTVEDRIALIRPARLFRTAGVRILATEPLAACLKMNGVDAVAAAIDDERAESAPMRRRVDLVAAPRSSFWGPDESGLARFAHINGLIVIEDVSLLERLAEAVDRSVGSVAPVRSWRGASGRMRRWN